MDHLCYLCLVFVMLSRLFIAASWSADLLALLCDVYYDCVTFPIWYPVTGVVLDCIDY